MLADEESWAPFPPWLQHFETRTPLHPGAVNTGSLFKVLEKSYHNMNK